MTKPYNVNNERSVLAAVLSDKAARRKVTGFLAVEEFQGPEHRAIYEAVLAAGDEAELDTEVILLHDDGGKVERGLVDDIMTRVGAPKNLSQHLLRMRQDHRRIAAVPAAERLIELLKDRSREYEALVKLATSVLSGLADVSVDPKGGPELAKQYLEGLEQQFDGNVPFVTTGYGPLDRFLSEGWAKGLFSCIAARPRIGKTHMFVDMTTRLLRLLPRERILALPLEPGKKRFIDMMVCNATGVNIEVLNKDPRSLGLEVRDEIRRNVMKMIGMDDRLTVLDRPFAKALAGRWPNEEAMDKTEEIYSTGGYDIVLTDLWSRKLAKREASDVSRALVREQGIVQDFKLCSIAFHHISRKAEERRDKRPELSDLKESGGWEEVMDTVIGLHREKAYKPHVRKDVIEAIVLKQRAGRLGDVMEADFVGGVFRFENERGVEASERRPADSGARFVQGEDDPV
jgi:replicative DNA helicase